MGIFDALARRELTELRVLRAPKGSGDSDGYVCGAARTFDDGLDWKDFQQRFDTDTLPCARPEALGDAAVRDLPGMREPLAHLTALLAAGGHQMARLVLHRRLGIHTTLFVHSSVLGRNNGLHPLRAGGFRRHPPDRPEGDVLADGANLARAMSYKNAAAEIPLGGCKMTVHAEPIVLDDQERLGFIAYTIESGRFLTGPDMGFSPAHADALRARFTRHVTGQVSSGLGPTGVPTALGTFFALLEGAEAAFGSRSLEGRTVAIQGLGTVGSELARHVTRAGGSVIAADPDPAAVKRLQAQIDGIRIVDPETILSAPCDILAPCAIGGLFDDERIASLRCKLICGAANNQLAGQTPEEEIERAATVARRGILFLLDWTHNIGGVLSGFQTYLHGDEASQSKLTERLERVCRDGIRRTLETARATGQTPTEVAYETADRRLTPD